MSRGGGAAPAIGSTPFVEIGDRVAPAAVEGTVFECGLCGTKFTHGGQACGACPLNAGCDLVKCPSCGFQFPRSSKLVDWGRRALRRLSGGGR